MKDTRINAVQWFMPLLILFWLITNIQGMNSTSFDGKAINMRLMLATAEYAHQNSNDTINQEVVKLMRASTPDHGEWLLSSFYGDSLNYMRMAMGDPSFEPYSLRVGYPFVVGLIANGVIDLFDYQDKRFKVFALTYMTLNMACFFFSVIIGYLILRKFKIDPRAALVIPFLGLLQLGYTKILHAPMVDAPTVMLSLMFLLAILERNVIAVTLISVVMLLVKDSVIILGIIPFLLLIKERDKKWLLPIVAMPAVFVGLRVFSEVDPLSVQYGWNVSEGEVKAKYLKLHLGSMKGIINWLIGLWYAFGPFLLLIGYLMFRVKDQQEKFFCLGLVVASVFFIIAQIVLAASIARSVTPISVPVAIVAIALWYKYSAESGAQGTAEEPEMIEYRQ